MLRVTGQCPDCGTNPGSEHRSGCRQAEPPEPVPCKISPSLFHPYRCDCEDPLREGGS